MYRQIILLSFEILACISDNFLRPTTAHTQKLNNIIPYLPLKVVLGSIILLSYFAAVSEN
jgi:hypothetical protein